MLTHELLGEFFGTCLLVLLGDGIVANNCLAKSKGKDAGWLAITLGWGLAVMVGSYASGILGPAHLNPAVTIAFAVKGSLPWSSVLPYILAQLAGGFIGAILVWLAYYKHFEETTDSDTILGIFSTEPAIRSYLHNFITEAIGTFVLVFAVMTFAKNNLAAGLNPLIVSGLIVSIGLSIGGATGYAINPTRDLAPRLAHSVLPISHKGRSDWAYAWVPIFGPIVGAILASLAYMALPL